MEVDHDGNYATRTLDDGRILYVYPIMYGQARLSIAPPSTPLYYDATY